MDTCGFLSLLATLLSLLCRPSMSVDLERALTAGRFVDLSRHHRSLREVNLSYGSLGKSSAAIMLPSKSSAEDGGSLRNYSLTINVADMDCARQDDEYTVRFPTIVCNASV